MPNAADWTIDDLSWADTSTFTLRHAVIYAHNPMPPRLRRMKGKRGKGMRGRWARTKMIGYVNFKP